MQQHAKLGDSTSLWNCTLSPGWRRDEVSILRMAIMKFGVGRWKEIIDSGCLPGKTPSQLSLQCQRLIGQQSLGEYMSIHLDTNVVFEKNSKKEGLRKNGCLINSGKTQTPEERSKKLQQNTIKYSLSQEDIDSIVLPDRSNELLYIREKQKERLKLLLKRKKELEKEYFSRFDKNYEYDDKKIGESKKLKNAIVLGDCTKIESIVKKKDEENNHPRPIPINVNNVDSKLICSILQSGLTIKLQRISNIGNVVNIKNMRKYKNEPNFTISKRTSKRTKCHSVTTEDYDVTQINDSSDEDFVPGG